MTRRLPRFSLADALRECLHTLGARPGRSLLAVLSLVMGVGAVVAVMCLRSSSVAAVEAQFESLGVNDVALSLATSPSGASGEGEAPAFDQAGLERVRELPWTAAAVGIGDPGSFDVSLDVLGTYSAPAQTGVYAVSGGAEAMGATLTRGRWPTPAEYRLGAPVAVVSATLAGSLGLDRLADLPAVLIAGREVQIVGVAAPGRQLSELSAGLWLNPEAARVLLGADGFGAIKTIAVSGAAAALARDAPVAAYPADPSHVGVESALGAQRTQAAVGSTFDGLTIVLAAIVLAVGGVGIGSMTLVSVVARTQEIAVRRAVGSTRGQIFGLILAESALLGVVGALAGLTVGLASGALTATARGWPLPTLDPSIAAVPLIAVLVAVLGGTSPALRAARIPPALALRAI